MMRRMTTNTKIMVVFLVAIFVAIGSNTILFRVAITSSSSSSSSSVSSLSSSLAERRPQQQQLEKQQQQELEQEKQKPSQLEKQKQKQQQQEQFIFPLKPPYYIVQHGSVRSGSTFQSQLLMTIIELKSTSKQQQQQQQQQLKSRKEQLIVPNYYMNSLDPDYRQKTQQEKTKGNPNSEEYLGTTYFNNAIKNGFVLKTHKISWINKLLDTFTNMTDVNDDNNEQQQQQQRRRQVAIFVSREDIDDNIDDANADADADADSENNKDSYDESNIVLIQSYKELVHCSLCTIDSYKYIFDLSDDEIVFLKQYMSKYEILRRCCGFQMSKYERLRLHGCNVTEYQLAPNSVHNYPWCENYDLQKIELEFTNNSKGIQYHSGENIRKVNWNKPGDCTYFENEIRYNNKDFNGRPWDKTLYGCDFNIIDSSNSQNTIRKEKRISNNNLDSTKLQKLKEQTVKKRHQRQQQQIQIQIQQQQQQQQQQLFASSIF